MIVDDLPNADARLFSLARDLSSLGGFAFLWGVLGYPYNRLACFDNNNHLSERLPWPGHLPISPAITPLRVPKADSINSRLSRGLSFEQWESRIGKQDCPVPADDVFSHEGRKIHSLPCEVTGMKEDQNAIVVRIKQASPLVPLVKQEIHILC